MSKIPLIRAIDDTLEAAKEAADFTTEEDCVVTPENPSRGPAIRNLKNAVARLRAAMEQKAEELR